MCEAGRLIEWQFARGVERAGELLLQAGQEILALPTGIEITKQRRARRERAGQIPTIGA